jgi:hypothetical protein
MSQVKHIPAPRGMTMMEVIISMGVLSFGFLLAMQVLKTMSEDMYAESVQSDIHERSSGSVYKMIADLQGIVSSDSEVTIGLNLTEKNPAAAVSGNLPAGGPGIGNAITYRICKSVDTDGNPVYSPDPDGAVKIRYRWLLSNRENTAAGDADQNGIRNDGYILKERLGAGNAVISAETIVDHTPAQMAAAGREPYGFTIERKITNMREIYITVQRSVDQRKATEDRTTATATVKRRIFLRNK